MNKHGLTLIGVLIAITILAFGVVISTQSTQSTTKAQREAKQALYAQAHATELLEFFQTFTSVQMLSYLSENPVDNTLAPYFLCSHINILDRNSGNLVNRDPIAELPSFLLSGRSEPNRYYQVFIVNAETLEIDTSRCEQDATTMTPLNATERVLMRVGVSWIHTSGYSESRTVTSLLN